VPTQMAQSRFPVLATSSAKILIYFSNKTHDSNIIKTPLGNCYGLKLLKCSLQFKKKCYCVICSLLSVSDPTDVRHLVHATGRETQSMSVSLADRFSRIISSFAASNSLQTLQTHYSMSGLQTEMQRYK